MIIIVVMKESSCCASFTRMALWAGHASSTSMETNVAPGKDQWVNVQKAKSGMYIYLYLFICLIIYLYI